MKPLARLSILALLSVPVSSLTLLSTGGNQEKAHHTHELGDDPFRSDSTLRFMRKLHKSQHPLASTDEALRTQVCGQHGFKATERTMCVAFMREACRKGPKDGKKSIESKSCVSFFREEQPGYHSESTKLSAKKLEKQNPLPDAPAIPGMDDLQQGPNYDSKKAQKATAKAAKVNEKQAKEQEKADGILEKAGDAVGAPIEGAGAATDGAVGAGNDAGEAVQDSIQDIGRGPEYKDKEAQAATADQLGEVAEKQGEFEPEDKEVPSVPGCKNAPKGWQDKKGNDCEDYAEGEWCTRRGGYGDAWLDDWGTFEDVAKNGVSAKTACCVCGGGHVKGGGAPAPAGVVGGAPAPAGAPGMAPMPGPILGGMAYRPLQSQGYEGEHVMHEDGETMTDDWGREFGPQSGSRDIKKICEEHPGNEWCELHGYYDSERSAAGIKSSLAVAVTLLLACLQ